MVHEFTVSLSSRVLLCVCVCVCVRILHVGDVQEQSYPAMLWLMSLTYIRFESF